MEKKKTEERKENVGVATAAASVLVCKHSICWRNTVVTVAADPSKLLERRYIEVLRLADSRPSLSTVQLSSGRNDRSPFSV